MSQTRKQHLLVVRNAIIIAFENDCIAISTIKRLFPNASTAELENERNAFVEAIKITEQEIGLCQS